MANPLPLRRIVSRQIRKERGPTGRIFTTESLECGHTFKTTATGAVRKAKRRRCYLCQIETINGNAP